MQLVRPQISPTLSAATVPARLPGLADCEAHDYTVIRGVSARLSGLGMVIPEETIVHVLRMDGEGFHAGIIGERLKVTGAEVQTILTNALFCGHGRGRS